MTDDNQKFLDKFKNQISKMGKDGILGTDNDISSISNINNNNNKYTNIIIKNSLTDKNNIKKGSAFLKPINKSKINSHNNSNINNGEQSKNNPNDNENKILENNNINKYNTINNPYISNNNSNLLKPNEIMNFQGIPYYPYPSHNPYFYYNNNNINNMNNPPQQVIFPPPYQLYYYSNPYIQNNNQNQNIPNVNINDNNIIKTQDNIKKKRKLRPISAQMVGRSKSFMNNTNTTINTNYTNNNNITTFTNSKYEYKPYTLKDYKEIINVDSLGGLGANIGTEEWEKKKEKMDKMSEYAKNIFKKTRNSNKNKDKISKKKML